MQPTPAVLADLHLHERAQLHVSAASGLLWREDALWVVSDDRSLIDRIDPRSGAPLEPIVLLDGAPSHPKASKPDLEALIDLGARGVLALGSGSRAQRRRGFWHRAGAVRVLDLTPLYTHLEAELGTLNIEGGLLRGDELWLAHRGTGQASALVRVDARAVLGGDASAAQARPRIDRVALGMLDGIMLGWTDLAADPDGRVWFLAAAENTTDPYLDGHCAGSVIGVLDDVLRPRVLARLRPDIKAEGLCLCERDARTLRGWVVSDADDPAQPAALYELELPRGFGASASG